MKKVLIIANLFHASPRIASLATHLPEFGWEATIITPPLGDNFKKQFNPSEDFFANTTIIEVPYCGDIFWFYRKIFAMMGFNQGKSIPEQLKEKIGIKTKKSFLDILVNCYQELFGFPDAEKYWISPATKAGIQTCKTAHFDAIISSSPYPSSHLIAKKISGISKIPWVADFRDLWSQNNNYPYGKIRQLFDMRLELKTISTAIAIIAASEGDAKTEEKFCGQKVKMIRNGFDESMFEGEKPALSKKFTITYTGMIYFDKQDSLKLLDALEALIREAAITMSDVEVNFYGEKSRWLDSEIQKRGLEEVVFQRGRISREQSVAIQKSSQVLLLLCWEDKKNMYIYPSKVFEYFAARRPILATGGYEEEDIKKTIKKFNFGIRGITLQDIKKAIMVFYNEFKKEGRVLYHGDEKEIDQYSTRAVAQKFSEVLNAIVK